MGTDIEAHLTALANEMHKLIGENFANEPDEAVHQRLQEIKDEIHSHGWEVRWSIGFDPHNFKGLDVVVELLQPKSDLSPEDQKIYDDWFRKNNDITEA